MNSSRNMPSGMVVFLCLIWGGLSLAVAASGVRKPNMIVILTDDLGYNDFGCYGAKDIDTPQIDRMALEGTKFTSFYVAPVCSPSRASFMTGCYPLRVSINGVLFPRNDIGLNTEEIILPELLKQQGYATALVGKWHLGFLLHQLPQNHGFDYWYGTLSSNSSPLEPQEQIYNIAEDCVFRDGFSRESIGKKKLECPLFRNNRIIEAPADQELFTRRYTEEAIRFMQTHKDGPFFLYLAHNMPHAPVHASDAFKGTSRRGLYGDVIQELDWGIGKVLDAVRELGLEENTLVILTSDNGPKLEFGGSALPLRGAKGDTFEGGVRVPCIMRWLGKIPGNRVNDEIIGIIDLMPTLVSLAGGSVPTDRKIDGANIWPVVAGIEDAKSPHEAVNYLRGRNVTGIRMDHWKLHYSDPPKDDAKKQVELTREEMKLLRDERKALIKERSRESNPKKGPELSLYNLDEDIGEEHNVIEQHPVVAQRLGDMMKSFEDELRRNTRKSGTEE